MGYKLSGTFKNLSGIKIVQTNIIESTWPIFPYKLTVLTGNLIDAGTVLGAGIIINTQTYSNPMNDYQWVDTGDILGEGFIINTHVYSNPMNDYQWVDTGDILGEGFIYPYNLEILT